MRIAVLDDYQRAAHRFADWSRLRAHEVTFFHEPLPEQISHPALVLYYQNPHSSTEINMVRPESENFL